jgi:hypothetical protein
MSMGILGWKSRGSFVTLACALAVSCGGNELSGSGARPDAAGVVDSHGSMDAAGIIDAHSPMDSPHPGVDSSACIEREGSCVYCAGDGLWHCGVVTYASCPPGVAPGSANTCSTPDDDCYVCSPTGTGYILSCFDYADAGLKGSHWVPFPDNPYQDARCSGFSR